MRILITFLIISSYFIGFAQVNGSAIRGVITNSDNNESIPFCNVSLLQDHKQVLGASSDFDGFYNLTPILKGCYTLKFSFIGYQTILVKEIELDSGITFEFNIKLKEGVNLPDLALHLSRSRIC